MRPLVQDERVVVTEKDNITVWFVTEEIVSGICTKNPNPKYQSILIKIIYQAVREFGILLAFLLGVGRYYNCKLIFLIYFCYLSKQKEIEANAENFIRTDGNVTGLVGNGEHFRCSDLFKQY